MPDAWCVVCVWVSADMEALARPDPELGNWGGTGEGNKRLIELAGIPTFSSLFHFYTF